MGIKDIIKKEGDILQWDYKCKNNVVLSCEIIRNSLSFLCGYVKFNKDISLHGISYDDIYMFTQRKHRSL
jgi:hypothetical protein